jgi:hypothetical protein
MANGRKVEFFHDVRFDCDVLIIDGLEQCISYQDSRLPVGEFKERIIDPMLGILDATRPQPGWDDIASRMASCG